MPRPGGHMRGPGMGRGMGGHRGGPGGPGGFGGGPRGGFGGHGGPPPPPRGGFGGGMFGRGYRGYRRPYHNPGCLGGCLTFLLGSGGIIALIVLALSAIF